MSDYPEPLEGDPDAVVTALEVGASMWARGEHGEAIKWLRKAVDEAFEAGLDARGLTLSKSAAAIASLVPPPPSASPSSPAPPRSAQPPPVPVERAPDEPAPQVAAPHPPSAAPRALPTRPPSIPVRSRTSRPPAPRITARAPRVASTAAPKTTLPSPGGPSPATTGPEASAAIVESAHDALDANSRPTFDPKLISPLGMMRMSTPAHPPPVHVPVDVAPIDVRVPLAEPPQGSTRPALPESLRASPLDSLDLDDRSAWTTTTAARVAVSHDGERVVVRRFDGSGLRAGEVEAILVGVPDAAALLEMLALGGRARE